MSTEAPRDHGRIPLAALALAATAGAMLVLTLRTDGTVPDYGVGAVPAAVPWLAAALVVVVAVAGLTRVAASPTATVLVACLTVLTAWPDGALLFDALRVVRLVPLPLDGWGFGLRLLLLVGAISAVQPIITARHNHSGRCPSCGRWRPGPLARIPRWPVVVGVVFALPYPTLRIIWLLGGTLGTTGAPVDVDPTLQLVMASAGLLLLALTIVLAIDRGPTWLRVVLGLAGLTVGTILAATFAPAAVGALQSLTRNGLTSSPGSDLMGWVFALFYASWTVCGIGTALGGLRYWTHRRKDCTTCWPPPATWSTTAPHR